MTAENDIKVDKDKYIYFTVDEILKSSCKGIEEKCVNEKEKISFKI
jgi:hypothetical protein